MFTLNLKCVYCEIESRNAYRVLVYKQPLQTADANTCIRTSRVHVSYAVVTQCYKTRVCGLVNPIA